MIKHWSFHVQSCLGMVWDLFENFDFRTILTPSDFRKGTLPNFGHFDSQSWVQDKDHPELLSLNILCADRFKPKHGEIKKKKKIIMIIMIMTWMTWMDVFQRDWNPPGWLTKNYQSVRTE